MKSSREENWSPIFFWYWDIEDNTCAICRFLISSPCIHCQSDDANEDCPNACGACQHVYHFHCISRWLRRREVCPIDHSPWQYRN